MNKNLNFDCCGVEGAGSMIVVLLGGFLEEIFYGISDFIGGRKEKFFDFKFNIFDFCSSFFHR